MTVDALRSLVSSAIWRAEQLEDLGLETAPLAWTEVSRLEEALAKLMPAKEPEGRIARRGAVRAALKANDLPRARDLVERYAGDGASRALRNEMREMMEAAAKGFSEEFPWAAKHYKPGDFQRLANLFWRRGPFSLAAA